MNPHIYNLFSSIFLSRDNKGCETAENKFYDPTGNPFPICDIMKPISGICQFCEFPSGNVRSHYVYRDNNMCFMACCKSECNTNALKCIEQYFKKARYDEIKYFMTNFYKNRIFVKRTNGIIENDWSIDSQKDNMFSCTSDMVMTIKVTKDMLCKFVPVDEFMRLNKPVPKFKFPYDIVFAE